MEDIIYINEHTGQVVPATYPDAVAYVRKSNDSPHDGIVVEGKLFELVKDEISNFVCEKCALFPKCETPFDSACFCSILFNKQDHHFEIKEGGEQ